jgi:hypothetical protein
MHPIEQELNSFARREKLSLRRRIEIRSHLTNCELCQQTYARIDNTGLTESAKFLRSIFGPGLPGLLTPETRERLINDLAEEKRGVGFNNNLAQKPADTSFGWLFSNWQIAAVAGLILLMLSGLTTLIFLERENSELVSNLKNTDINTGSEKVIPDPRSSPTVAMAEDSGNVNSKKEDRQDAAAKITNNLREAANSDYKPNSEFENRRLATETALQRPKTQSNKNTINQEQLIAGDSKNLRFPASLRRVQSGEILTLKGAAVKTEFDIIAPTRTFLRDASPTFIWQKVPNAVRYEVAVREVKGSTTIINESTTTTSYKSPTGKFEPHRGKVLQWSVTAYLPDNTSISSPSGTEPEALFLILDKKKVDSVENNLRVAGENHLTKAVILANTGLLEDAKNELQIFLSLHPRSKKAQTLLKQIQLRQQTKKITTPNR